MPTRLVRVGKIAPGTAPVWPHLGKRFCPPYAFRSEMSGHHQKQRFLMTKSNQLDFSTRCIHAGQEPDPTTGAVMMPIYATSTYVQQSPGVNKGYDYARTKNPTRMAFERCIADLEGGSAAFAFASGLAAIATTLECLDQGSHVVAVDDLYGGSRRLFERVGVRSAGIEATDVDLTDADALVDAIWPCTRVISIESQTKQHLEINVLLRVHAHD